MMAHLSVSENIKYTQLILRYSQLKNNKRMKRQEKKTKKKKKRTYVISFDYFLLFTLLFVSARGARRLKRWAWLLAAVLILSPTWEMPAGLINSRDLWSTSGWFTVASLSRIYTTEADRFMEDSTACVSLLPLIPVILMPSTSASSSSSFTFFFCFFFFSSTYHIQIYRYRGIPEEGRDSHHPLAIPFLTCPLSLLLSFSFSPAVSHTLTHPFAHIHFTQTTGHLHLH